MVERSEFELPVPLSKLSDDSIRVRICDGQTNFPYRAELQYSRTHRVALECRRSRSTLWLEVRNHFPGMKKAKLARPLRKKMRSEPNQTGSFVAIAVATTLLQVSSSGVIADAASASANAMARPRGRARLR